MAVNKQEQGYNTEETMFVEPVELEDGQQVILTRRNPYGHIYLSLVKGSLPDKYQGAYTTPDYARQDVAKYAEERKLATKELKKSK